MYIRDTVVSSSNFESVVLNCQPNNVIYFDTSSYLNSVNAAMIPITASWALTASITQVFVSSSFANTASYSGTSSFAINANSSPSSSWASASISASYAVNADTASMMSNSPYITLATSSLNWITASLGDDFEFVALTISASYNFTCSNLPTGNVVSEVSMLISHSAPFTSSLSFPSNWSFLGIKPTSVTGSRMIMLDLMAFGSNYIIATWAPQF